MLESKLERSSYIITAATFHLPQVQNLLLGAGTPRPSVLCPCPPNQEEEKSRSFPTHTPGLVEDTTPPSVKPFTTSPQHTTTAGPASGGGRALQCASAALCGPGAHVQLAADDSRPSRQAWPSPKCPSSSRPWTLTAETPAAPATRRWRTKLPRPLLASSSSCRTRGHGYRRCIARW